MDEPREPAPEIVDTADATELDEAEWEWALELEGDEPRVTSLDRLPRAGEAQARGRWWRRQWRWTLRLGALAASVALLGALAVALAPLLAPFMPRSVASAARSDILALDLAPGLSVCATTGYWSPDGSRIAVLRSPAICGITPREADVYIYDAASGNQVATYHVTSAVRAALGRAGAGSWTVTYDQLSWAPSRHALAVLFHAQLPPDIPTAPGDRATLPGLALITPGASSASAVSVMLASASAAAGLLPAPPGQVYGMLWDTRQGGARVQAVPVAQAYDWLPDDSLIATEPYPGDNPSDVPPFTWRPFSAWRTGTLSVANTAQCQGRSGANPPTPFALLTLSVATWSLDSRYLLAFQTHARAAAPDIPLDATAHDCLTSDEVSALPQAPIHDRATLAALRLLGASDAERMTLLWSPDGKRLVSLTSGPAIPATAATVYDTATGLPLARIIAGQSQIPGAQGSDASAIITGAAWSPNGRRLLVAITGLRFNIRVYSGHTLG